MLGASYVRQTRSCPVDEEEFKHSVVDAVVARMQLVTGNYGPLWVHHCIGSKMTPSLYWK